MTRLTECNCPEREVSIVNPEWALADRFVLLVLILFFVGVGFLAGRCSAPTLRPAAVAMEPAPDFSGKGPEL